MALTTTTLAEYKAWAGIGTTADDTRLTAIIASVTALCGRRCGRLYPLYTWDTGTYTEKLDGRGHECLILTNTPVTSVTSVTITDGTGATLETLASTDYKTEAATGRLSMTPTYAGRQAPDFALRAWEPVGFPVWGHSPVFPDQFQNVTVVYVGGYAVGSAPEDLKMALWRVTDWVRNKGPAAGGASPAGSFATSDFDEFVASVMRDYVRDGNA